MKKVNELPSFLTVREAKKMYDQSESKLNSLNSQTSKTLKDLSRLTLEVRILSEHPGHDLSEIRKLRDKKEQLEPQLNSIIKEIEICEKVIPELKEKYESALFNFRKEAKPIFVQHTKQLKDALSEASQKNQTLMDEGKSIGWLMETPRLEQTRFIGKYGLLNILDSQVGKCFKNGPR